MMKNTNKFLLRQFCSKTKKEYLCCDLNQTEEGYQSPFDMFKEGLEQKLNIAFEAYCRSYYEDAISSVYVLDDNKESFEIFVIIQSICNDEVNQISNSFQKEDAKQKVLETASSKIQLLGNAISSKIFPSGDIQKKEREESAIKKTMWQSVHKIKVYSNNNSFKYQTETDFLIELQGEHDDKRIEFILSITDQNKREVSEEKPQHIVWIGKLIEETENRMRSRLRGVYLDPTKNVCETF